ncbi:MAG: response regulator [Kiritimatiellaeota bacterium]|nr:response regulator [Kiritimatiellota bacterium]
MQTERLVLVDVSRVPSDQRRGELIIRKFPFRIGREPSGAGGGGSGASFETANDLTIPERRQPFNVSRNHLEIGFLDGRLYVRDVGSASGTVVNGKHIGGKRKSQTVLVDGPKVEVVLGKADSPWRLQLLLPTNERRRKLLIADDEDALRIALRRMFEKDYDVIEAPDGTRALQVCLEEQPDAALLDWIMPGIEGVKVCKAVKSSLKAANIPIIMVTALAATMKRVEGIEAGADDYVGKPFDPTDLRARVDAAVARSQRVRNTDWLTGVPSEAAFRDELDALLEQEGAAKSYVVLLATFSGLGTLQAAGDAAAADRVVQRIGELFWKLNTETERTVIGRLGMNVWAVLAPAARAKPLAVDLKRRLEPILAQTPLRVAVHRRRLNRCRNYLDFIESI